MGPYLKTYIHSEAIITKIISKFTSLNEFIEDSDKSNLGKGFRVGHSYFCVKPVNGQSDEDWYQTIINFEILPLLYEYWWDDTKKADEWKGKLLGVN